MGWGEIIKSSLLPKEKWNDINHEWEADQIHVRGPPWKITFFGYHAIKVRLTNRKLPGTRLNPRTQLYPRTQFHPIVQFHPRTGLNPRPQFNPIVQFIPGTRFAQRSLTASVLWFDRVVPATFWKGCLA